jgi:hypothetical protein
MDLIYYIEYRGSLSGIHFLMEILSTCLGFPWNTPIEKVQNRKSEPILSLHCPEIVGKHNKEKKLAEEVTSKTWICFIDWLRMIFSDMHVSFKKKSMTFYVVSLLRQYPLMGQCKWPAKPGDDYHLMKRVMWHERQQFPLSSGFNMGNTYEYALSSTARTFCTEVHCLTMMIPFEKYVQVNATSHFWQSSR